MLADPKARLCPDQASPGRESTAGGGSTRTRSRPRPSVDEDEQDGRGISPEVDEDEQDGRETSAPEPLEHATPDVEHRRGQAGPRSRRGRPSGQADGRNEFAVAGQIDVEHADPAESDGSSTKTVEAEADVQLG